MNKFLMTIALLTFVFLSGCSISNISYEDKFNITDMGEEYLIELNSKYCYQKSYDNKSIEIENEYYRIYCRKQIENEENNN